MKHKLLGLFLLSATGILAQKQFETTGPLYGEAYRPQYHFTPAHRWIGDPCGLIKSGGKYRAYSWGAAESPDLIHWKELNNHAIKGMPKRTSAFTGSVVVDSANTAGYGPGTWVAVYTSFDEDSKKQSQSIALSHDGGVTFQDYDLNPVVDTWSTEFRDPTVVWDPVSKRWVMAVAKALEKKIAFYGSDNLKNWEWLSDFGPLGDSERSWECPDLFRLPVNGNPENVKWVLVVSVNWAREQYFTGHFDGVRFIVDDNGDYPLYVDDGLDYYASRVFQNADDPMGPVYTLGWVNTWDYAQAAPSKWGKGVWSLPRQYGLVTTPAGIRLTQTPVEAVKSLRNKPWRFDGTLRTGVTPLPGVSPMDNTYEMKAAFKCGSDPFGLYLCQGDGRKLAVSFDPASGYLDVDRTHVAMEDIPKFERVAHCALGRGKESLDLRIFVDRSTVEIFVDDGQKVLTLLTYPGRSQTGASLWSLGHDTKAHVTVWPLSSIH